MNPLAHQQKDIHSQIREIAEFVFITILIVLPIRYFIAQPFIVSGSSMDTTFSNGQYLIVDELSYRFQDPQRGDVVIFRYPKDPKVHYIKRIIGLPYETVIVTGNTVVIKNDQHPNGFTLQEPYISSEREQDTVTTLGKDQYFVMGDNRAVSSDSRIWGALDKSFITGRAFIRLLPPQSASLFPGKATY